MKPAPHSIILAQIIQRAYRYWYDHEVELPDIANIYRQAADMIDEEIKRYK